MPETKLPTSSIPKENASPDTLQVINLRRCWEIIRERWLLAAFTAILACSLGGYFLFSQTPVYQSRALLLVDRASDRVVDVQEVVATDLGNDAQGNLTNLLIQTHIGEMSSRHFVVYLLETLSEEDAAALVEPYTREAWWHPRTLVGLVRPSGPVDPVDLVYDNLRIRRADDTLMIDVRFSHRDPDVAAWVANGVVQRYIARVMERSAGSHDRAGLFLRERVNELRAKVENLEREAQSYREEHNLVSLEENQNIVAQQVSQVSAALTAARLERVALESRLQQVERLVEEGVAPRELQAFPGFAFLQEASNAMDVLQNEREVLGERYLENHPRMRETEQAIEALQATIQTNLAQAVNDLRHQYHAGLAEEQELLQQLKEAERMSLELAQHATRYDLIWREVELGRTAYANLLTRLQETGLSAQLANTNLRVAEPAITPRRPASPRLLRATVLIAFMGGLVFVGLPLGINAVDTRLRRSCDVEFLLQRQLLGEIPRLPKGHAETCDDESPATESLRGVYSYLIYGRHKAAAGSVFSVVSSMPGEGKSFLAANLGRISAAHGKRTLVIDCDLRGPSIARALKIDVKEGLESYLRSSKEGKPSASSLGRLIHRVDEDFFVLPAGRSSRSATELLERGHFDVLLDACRESFDVVIVDTPPLKVFPDALQIAPHMDGVIYACQFGRINRDLLKELVGRVEKFHGDAVMGIVLNKMPVGRGGLYNYSMNGYYGDADYEKYYEQRKAG